MQPIVTDGVAWSVGLSRSWSWCMQKPLNRSKCFLGRGLGWARGTTYQMGVQIPQCEGANSRAEGAAHCLSYGSTDWDAILDVYSGGSNKECIRWGSLWHHLANTTEPSMCSSDADFLSNYFDHMHSSCLTDLLLQFCPDQTGFSERKPFG